MRRISLTSMVVLLLLCFYLPVAAQEATESPESAQLQGLVERAENAVTAAENHALRAEESADESKEAIDLGFNLLGLFEAFGGIISILAVAGGVLGVQRLRALERNLNLTRTRFEKELTESRTRFQEELAVKEGELTSLREELRREADDQRSESERAMLAMSLLPLGERQYRAQDMAGALDIYNQALTLDDDNLVVHHRLGYVYTQIGELQKAEEHLMRALELDSNFVPAVAALGYVYRRMSETLPANSIERGIMLARAEEKLRQALKISPRLVDDDGELWWGSLGGLHRRREQIDDAIDAYKRAAEVTPQSSYPFSNLALLYLLKGDYDKMTHTYRNVEKLAYREVLANVDNYWGYADLLTARLALGNTELAEDALESVFTTAPQDAPYFLESLMETLTRLEQVLAKHDTAKAETVESVIKRIRAHQNAAAMMKEQAS